MPQNPKEILIRKENLAKMHLKDIFLQIDRELYQKLNFSTTKIEVKVSIDINEPTFLHVIRQEYEKFNWRIEFLTEDKFLNIIFYPIFEQKMHSDDMREVADTLYK